MDALTIRDQLLSPTEAAEVLALAPDVPAVMTDDDVRAAISAVLDAHGGDLTACLADLAYAYGDHPDETCSRMSRCVVLTAHLTGVTP